MSKRKPGWWIDTAWFWPTLVCGAWATFTGIWTAAWIANGSPAYLLIAAVHAVGGGVWLWSILTWDRRMAAWKAAHGDD